MMNKAASWSRSVYVRVNLDAITKNMKIMRNLCPAQTGVIGVVKAGAYGHGSVVVSKHLKKLGIERLAVATVQEGIHLRNNGLNGPIHVFGNVQGWEMLECLKNHLIPTVSSEEAVKGMATALRDNKQRAVQISDVRSGSVNIKVDSGLARNGCQPLDLDELVEKCESLDVPLDGIYTQFSDSWSNLDLTEAQYDTFLEAVAPHRSRGIHCHVANSGAILRGYGTDLDFVRPGIAVYGLPPEDACEEFQSFGLKPAASVIGCPTLVKTLKAGRSVGYNGSYTADGEEYIATIPLGYADGYWRQLSGRGVIIRNKTGGARDDMQLVGLKTAAAGREVEYSCSYTTDGDEYLATIPSGSADGYWRKLAGGQGIVIRNKTGERLRVVGRVSMDSITISLPECVPVTESFTILSDDYDPQTSACGLAASLGTLSDEVTTRLSLRLMRVYIEDSKPTVVKALSPEIY